jgi:flagellar hook-basal body complex protein FliE
MTISPISSNLLNSVAQTASSTSANSVSSGIDQVGSTFQDMLSSLNDSQTNTDNLVSQMATGGDVDLHNVMIGIEENDVNFQVALSIRDKLVSAYQEIMRMSV